MNPGYWGRHPGSLSFLADLRETYPRMTLDELALSLTRTYKDRIGPKAIWAMIDREKKRQNPRFMTKRLAVRAPAKSDQEGAIFSPMNSGSQTAENTSQVSDFAIEYAFDTFANDIPKDRPKEYFDSLEAASRNWQKSVTPTPLRVIDPVTDKPHALVFMCDLHIGAKGTDYKKLREDIDIIRQTEGVSVILGGDIWHNHKTGRSSQNALYDSIASPDEQIQWGNILLAPIMRKIVGVISGNHEGFDRESGRNVLEQWCKEMHLPYWGHGNAVKVVIDMQEYYGAVRHTYKGSVKTAGKRVYDEMARPAGVSALDFVYLGHLHENIQMVENRPSIECHYLRGGSYLVYSDFAWDVMGAYKTDTGVPSIIMYPDKHMVVSFGGPKLEYAMRYLKTERSYAYSKSTGLPF